MKSEGHAAPNFADPGKASSASGWTPQQGSSPALWRDGSIPHHRRGRSDPDGMGVEELVLPPHLKQVKPVA